MMNKIFRKIKETDDTTELLQMRDSIPLQQISFAEKKELLNVLNSRYYELTYLADTEYASDEWRPATGNWLFDKEQIESFILSKHGIPPYIKWLENRKCFTINVPPTFQTRKLLKDELFTETWEVTLIKSGSKIYSQLISPLFSTIAKIRNDFYYSEDLRCISLKTSNIIEDLKEIIKVEEDRKLENDLLILYYFITDDSLMSENYEFVDPQHRVIFSAAAIKDHKMVQLQQSSDTKVIQKFLTDNGYPVNIYPEDDCIKIYIPSIRCPLIF